MKFNNAMDSIITAAAAAGLDLTANSSGTTTSIGHNAGGWLTNDSTSATIAVATPGIASLSPTCNCLKTEKKTKLNDPIAIAKIADIEVIVPNKVIKVTFSDGGSEKAVCDTEDAFNFETGVTICIMKHLLGGSKEYNKLIRSAVKVYDKKIDTLKKEEKEKERIKIKKEKERKKREARKVRKIEEAIAIQSEAYRRAMEQLAK